MATIQTENKQIESLHWQRLGEGWIRAITESAFERLEGFCHPAVASFLLTPKRFQSLDNAADLAAKFRGWFGACVDFRVEASRVGQVGERLAIFYRFRLRDEDGWSTIEQQLYCDLKEGRVDRLHLLCSGFHPVETGDLSAPGSEPQAGEQNPVRDELLELYTAKADAGSTCALLTPAIKSRLKEMQSGQVLEVRVDDPTARGDIESWSRLSGNALVRVIDDGGQMLRFFVRKK